MNRKQKKFTKIYDKHIDSIYRFIFIKVSSKIIAEDLTSEVFLKTWQVFQKGERKKIKNPRAYLYITARHLVIDFYRTKKQNQTFPIEDTKEIEDSGQQLEESEKICSDMAIVQKAINNLKQDYQNIVIWRYVDNLSIKEITQILNKSDGAVRVLLHRAMERLKEELNSQL